RRLPAGGAEAAARDRPDVGQLHREPSRFILRRRSVAGPEQELTLAQEGHPLMRQRRAAAGQRRDQEDAGERPDPATGALFDPAPHDPPPPPPPHPPTPPAPNAPPLPISGVLSPPASPGRDPPGGPPRRRQANPPPRPRAAGRRARPPRRHA